MDYIWSRDDLWARLLNDSEDVQAWAAMRLFELYPDMAHELPPLLPQLKSAAASVVLSYASYRDCPPEITTFFDQTSEPEFKAAAAALMIRFGTHLSDDQLTDVDRSDMFARLTDTAAGFDFLLHCYTTLDGEPEALLPALAMACTDADLFESFDDAVERSERRAFINQHGKAWGCNLSHLRKVRSPQQALNTLQHALDSATTDVLPDEPWKRELCLELDENRRRLQDIAEAASLRLAEEDEIDSDMETGFLVICTMIIERDAVCRARLIVAQEVEELWQALVMRPWRTALSLSLTDVFRSWEPQRVLSALKQALNTPLTRVGYALQILKALELPERFELLMATFDDHSSIVRIKDAAKIFPTEAPQVSQHLLEHYREPLPEPGELLVLTMMPTPDVEDFFLTHFDHYMGHPWSEQFVEILERIASNRFLEPLMAEWRPGEKTLARAIAFIATLHDVQDSRLQPIQQAFDEDCRRGDRLRHQAETQPEKVLQELSSDAAPFALPLRCTVCHRTYHYELKTVYLNPKRTEELMIGQVIQCKGCDSIETYELSPAAAEPLRNEIIRFTLLAQLQHYQGEDDETSPLPETPLIPGKPQLEAGNRLFNSLSAAYHYLVQEVDKYPDSAEMYRRLANLLKNGSRSDLALPYYHKALELDPNESESQYNLTEIFVEQERYQEAIPYVEALVPYCREGDMDEDERRALFSWLLEHTTLIEQQTQHRIELFPAPSKQELSALDEGGERDPAVVYLTSFDLGDTGDFEDVYQMFRTGRVPETSRHSPERIRQRGGPVLTLPKEHVCNVSARTLQQPVRTRREKVGRNALCPCGSGKKYKKCCGR